MTDKCKGLTPDKQKRRPGGGNPSPVKKMGYAGVKIPPKKMNYRPQGK